MNNMGDKHISSQFDAELNNISAKVMEMVKGFRVYAKKVPNDPAKPDGDYVMDHTASVFLLDDKGRFAGTIAYQEDSTVAQTKLKNLISRNL